MRKKRPFSLLELIVGISILALVSSAVIWKMSRLIERKRFDSSVDRIQSRIFTCRRLAMNMQADWKAVLEKVVAATAQYAIVEKAPMAEGRIVSMVLSPKSEK